MNPPAEPARHGVKAPIQAFLTPGTLFCGAGPAVISTVLGSCVAVCLVDRHNRAAGMNHFVLPYNPAGEDSLRYGDVALERLLQRMVRLGCETKDIRAKLFGGAAVLPFGEAGDTVGTKNVAVALDWLRGHSIPVVARRTGGKNGLLIRFHTGSGRVMVRKITSGAGAHLSGPAPTYDSRFDLGSGEEL
jgi:chemotaxis protein CheD